MGAEFSAAFWTSTTAPPACCLVTVLVRWCSKTSDRPAFWPLTYTPTVGTSIFCVCPAVGWGQVTGRPLLQMDGQARVQAGGGRARQAARAVLEKRACKVILIGSFTRPTSASYKAQRKSCVCRWTKWWSPWIQHGNTSAASIPLALDHAVRAGPGAQGPTSAARKV